MKITDTTPPPVERTYTIELNQTELNTIRIALGITSQSKREESARQNRVTVLGDVASYQMYLAFDNLSK